MTMTNTDGRAPITVLGLGNVLCGDDGLGVSAIAELMRRFELAPEVRVLDGGTLGLALLPLMQTTRVAILVDAIDDGQAPGSFVHLRGHEVVRRAALRLSVHQIGVADLLDASALVGDGPSDLVLLGLVPGATELGIGLTGEVARAMPGLVAELAAEITRQGFPVVPRGEVLHATGHDPLGLVPLGL